MKCLSLNDDYLSGRDIEAHIDYLRVGNEYLAGVDSSDLRKWLAGSISIGPGDKPAREAAEDAINSCSDLDVLKEYADALGGSDLDMPETLTASDFDKIRAEIVACISGEAEAREFCDEFEINYANWFDPQIADEEECDELADWLDLKEQAEGYGDWPNCTLISESKWVDYCREFAYDIGEVQRDSLADTYLDWDRYADAMKSDYTEVEVDGNVFYVRA